MKRLLFLVAFILTLPASASADVINAPDASDMAPSDTAVDATLSDVAATNDAPDADAADPVDLRVDAVVPSMGLSNTEFRIRVEGVGLGAVPGLRILIGLIPCTDLLIESATSVSVTTPALPPGTYDVSAESDSGRSFTLPAGITLVEDMTFPAPFIANITPTFAPPGSAISLTGAAFAESAQVEVGDYSATTNWVDTATLSVILPNDIPLGVYDVRVVNPDGQFALREGGFEVVEMIRPDVVEADGGLSGGGPDCACAVTASSSGGKGALAGLFALFCVAALRRGG